MFNVPFQNNITLSERQQRTLALAGVFQSAQIAHLLSYGEMVAHSEHLAHHYFTQSVQASLNIRPSQIDNKNPLLYFQNLSHLSLGLQALENSITRPFSTAPKSKLPNINQTNYPTMYALALLQLEKKIYQRTEFVQRIEQMQQHILRQLAFFEYQYLHNSLIGNMAQCYTDTASTLKPRIIVKGKAEALQDVQQANRIRAVLMAGLQSAHLWRQLGGSSWGFVFGKGKILMDIRELIRLQYQQKPQQIQEQRPPFPMN